MAAYGFDSHKWMGGVVVALSASAFGMGGLFQNADVTALETARQLIVAAYPDLGTRRASMHMVTPEYPLGQALHWIRVLGLQISEPDAPRTGVATGITVPLLMAEVSFDELQHVIELRASGRFVNERRREVMEANVDRHTEWSDQEVLEALRAAGAHFSPLDIAEPAELFKQRSQGLGPFLGAVSIRSVVFEIRDRDQFEAKLSSAQLFWRVKAVTSVSADRPWAYDLLFEPFDGQLFEFKRRAAE